MNERLDNIAISSRVRLARNISGYNFFAKLQGTDDAKSIENAVVQVLKDFGNFNIIKLKDLSLDECNALLERHLISKELIYNKDIASVAISEDEKLIIMINEEDHIREQCIFDGLDLYKAYFTIKKFDDILLDAVNIAYSEKYGFLTSSPANLGTGMRASVMMFLPAIEINGDIDIVRADAKKKGFTVRGLYGEGSKPIGSFYQISNQNSLGLSEKEIVGGVSEFVDNVRQMEMSAREDLLSQNHEKLVDEIYRAYGILTECRLLGEEEMIVLLSKIRFGDALGLIKIVNHKTFDSLYTAYAKGNLKEIENISGNIKEEANRSAYISNRIRNLVRKMD
ncbi:MAG: ATP--guanido phosphotransferase [Clostridia bacterium]|nr:ATP--guanido phosphotransferase [Clostridia bacterium]